jgi:hypothetical protein
MKKKLEHGVNLSTFGKKVYQETGTTSKYPSIRETEREGGRERES